jgi:hypothetical protein
MNLRPPSPRPAVLALLAVAIAAAITGGFALATTSDTPHRSVETRALYGIRADDAAELDVAQELGVTTVFVRPSVSILDSLHAREMTAVVWLGDYFRDSCTFEYDDDTIRELVGDVAGHPAIAAYQIADEPRVTSCPRATADMAARSELVRESDPSAPTFVTVDAWNGVERLPYGDFAGTTDIMGLVIYPCELGRCELVIVDEAIERAEQAGVDTYWAIVQGFADEYYSLPDPETFGKQLERWTASEATGIAVFSWSFGTADIGSSPELQEVLHEYWADPECPFPRKPMPTGD